jgi:chemotaxis protein CheZ
LAAGVYGCLTFLLSDAAFGSGAASVTQDVSLPDLQSDIAELRRVVDRRLAELSAEVHGAVQMVDFSETNLSGQLGKIHAQIASVVAAPSVMTRNSGLELEAVVSATEAAANRIMEAAEAISDWLHSGQNDPDSLREVAERVNAIFEACTFQDVTGQRIRRAIEHLQSVESMLSTIIPAVGAPADGAAEMPPPPPAVDPDLHQDDVDRMFD